MPLFFGERECFFATPYTETFEPSVMKGMKKLVSKWNKPA